MIKKISVSLVMLLSLGLLSCSSEESNVEVFAPSSPLLLIPAQATSCYAIESAGQGTTPTPDIEPSYFKIATIGFGRKDSSRDLIISAIRIKIQVPYGEPILCSYGGESLNALAESWFATANKTREAVIPAGVASFSTTCPLYCGGFKTDNLPEYTAAGTLEVRGLERNAKGEEVPVKIETTVTVQSF